MKTNTKTLLLVGLCLPSSVLAFQAIDKDELFADGKKALSALALLPDGSVHVAYFNVMLGPDQVIGFIEASLLPLEKDDAATYRYVAKTVIHFPTGARLDVDVTAKLKANFEPVEVELDRKVIDPKGENKHSVQKAKVGAKKVSLSSEFGDQKQDAEVDRPATPLIFGIETMVQRLDFNRFQLFALNEFDLEQGSGRFLRFETHQTEDGTPTVITFNPDYSISYQFWFDNAGNLMRWGEASLPALFVRTNKDAVDRWKAEKLGSNPAEPANPTPSPGG